MPACTRCGHMMDAQAEFCSKCGTALKGAGGARSNDSDWDARRAAPPMDAPQERAAAPKSNTALIAVLGGMVALLLVVVVGCSGLLYLGMSRKGAGPAPMPAVRVSVPAPVLPPPPTVPDFPVDPSLPPGLAPLPDLTATPVEPNPVPDRKIHLEVTAETWREGKKPYDIRANLIEQFAREGIEVVADADAAVDGWVTVVYEETQGSAYHSFHPGEENGEHDHGEEPEVDPQTDPMMSSKIHFQLTLVRKAGAPACLELEQDTDLGMMPLVTLGKTMYEASIDAFNREDKPVMHAGALVGTALGRAGSAKKVIALMLDRDLGILAVDTLNSAGFKPATAEERARWALAEGDVATALIEKDAAMPVVVEYYDGLDWADDLSGQVEVVQEVTRMGGAAAAEFVGAQLAGEVVNRPEEPADPEEGGDTRQELVLELIKSAAKLKQMKAEVSLQKLCGDVEPKVAAAAQKALKDLGLAVPKVVPKPKPKPKPVEEP